jgi:hypothetical protein
MLLPLAWIVVVLVLEVFDPGTQFFFEVYAHLQVIQVVVIAIRITAPGADFPTHLLSAILYALPQDSDFGLGDSHREGFYGLLRGRSSTCEISST